MRHLFFETAMIASTIKFKPLFSPEIKTITFDNPGALLGSPLGTVWAIDKSKLNIIESEAHITDENVNYAVPVIFKGKNMLTTSEVDDSTKTIIATQYIKKFVKSEKGLEDEQIRHLANDTFNGYYDGDIEDLICPPDKRAKPGMGQMMKDISSKYPVPTIADTGFHIKPDIWNILIRNALRQENVMLVGPTGSGKTELAAFVAKAIGKELYYQDMGTIQDAQSALIGVHRLNKEGASVFDLAPFVSYIQSGHGVLLDELNRAPQSVNNLMFPCLDKRRYLPIDIADKDSERHVSVHPETFFMATANLGGEYTGTSTIDRALQDRFFLVELDYPEEKEEIHVIRLRTGIDEKSATAIVKACNAIRQQANKGDVSTSVSVRHSILAGSLVFDGFSVKDSLLMTVAPLFESSEGASERTKIKTAIAAF